MLSSIFIVPCTSSAVDIVESNTIKVISYYEIL